MTTRAITFLSAVALVACDGTSAGDLMAATLEADFAAQDLATINECRCWWQADGYPSALSCVDDNRIGELTDAERNCLATALEPYSKYQAYLDCVYQNDRALASCVDGAACTAQAFNDCYALFDSTHCASPCEGLSGAALTQCNADAAAMFSDAVACAN